MKKLLTFFLVALLAFGVGWAETVTYTFTSKSWTASPDNWTGTADGNQFNTSGTPSGVQVTTGAGNGATVTCPQSYNNITSIVVNYSSSSKGVGNIAVYVGDQHVGTQSISKSQTKVNLTYSASSLSGVVKFVPTVTANSMGINSVTITYTPGSTPAPEKWYRKVTSANDLVVDKKYIFMKENGQSSVGMGAITSSYGTPVTGLAISDNRVNIGGTGVVEFTLGGSSDAWTFKNPDNRYLGVVSETGDGFATSATLGGYTDLRWTVTSTGTVRNNKYTSKYIRCNSANSFGLYSSGTNAYLYVEDLEDCEAPTFDPVSGGTFYGSLDVTISSATSGATIYYTTDGSTPTTSSNSVASGGTVTINSSCTIKAIAVAQGHDNSTVAEASYTKETLPMPTFSPAGGHYDIGSTVEVTINAVGGAAIYYTLDGTDPVPSRTAYTGPITISETTTLKAISVLNGETSEVATAEYVFAAASPTCPAEIVFKNHTNSTTDISNSVITYVESGSDNVSSIAGTKVYTTTSQGIRIGTSSAIGQLTFNLNTQVADWKVRKVVVKAASYGDDNVSLKVTTSANSTGVTLPLPTSATTFTDYEFTGFDGSSVTSVAVATTLKRAYIKSVTIYYECAPVATLTATPNPLNINDTNEAGGKTGTILVSGDNLGSDNVGVDTYDPNHSTNFSSNPGYFSHNGTVTDYPVAITYTGQALSATGIVYPANNIVSTSVNINYLYTGPIYVIGDVNDTYWNTNNGALMTRDENGVYSTTVSVQQSDGTAGYITFTKQLGSNYSAGQFGPISNGNWWYNDGLNDIYQPIDTLGNKNNIRILPGIYTITVNPATNEFKIKRYVIDVTIDPADGTTFTGSTISGTITDSPAGTIEWSTDGNNWQPYTDGFTLTANQVGDYVTIYARSTSNGVTSTPVSATYQRVAAPAPEAPIFSRNSGDVARGTVITITAPEGTTLYVDGQPVSSPYDVVINHSTTISAYCVNDEGTHSETITNTYTIATVCEASIVFSGNGGGDGSTNLTNGLTDACFNTDVDPNATDGGIINSSSTTGSDGRLYIGKSTYGLKFGSGSYTGSLTINLKPQTEGWQVTKIIVNALAWSATEGQLHVTTSASTTGSTQTLNYGSGTANDFANYEFGFDGDEITSFTVSTTSEHKRCYVKSITLVYSCGPDVEAPVIIPATGTYYENQTVTITSEQGTTIYYTTNGTTPTTSSQQYTGEFTAAYTAGSTTTIKAIAIDEDNNESEVTTVVYTWGTPSVTIHPDSRNTMASSINVTLTSDPAEGTIYYTTDGSTPSAENGTAYSGPFTVNIPNVGDAVTVKAVTVYNDLTSPVASASYTHVAEVLDVHAPFFSPLQNRTFYGDQTLQIGCTTPNADIYYEIVEVSGTTVPSASDVDDPTHASNYYDGTPIEMTAGHSYYVKAIAYIGNYVSTITEGYFIIEEFTQTGNYFQSLKDFNDNATSGIVAHLVNPVQVVYHSTYTNDGYMAEFCYVRDNTDYGLIYFGKADQSGKHIFEMGDWLDGSQIVGTTSSSPYGYHIQLGNSSHEIDTWPTAAIGHNEILPEETTCQVVHDGTQDGENSWGHYIHLRYTTLNNVADDSANDPKHNGYIADQSGAELNYYDKFYRWSAGTCTYNNQEYTIHEIRDYDQAFFDSKQNDGATFDVYGVVDYYSAKGFQLCPIDFLWIYKPVISLQSGTYTSEQTVSISVTTPEWAAESEVIYYKTDDMEDWAIYTEPITVNSDTHLQVYAELPAHENGTYGGANYNDYIRSEIVEATYNFEGVEDPIITPASQVIEVVDGTENVDATVQTNPNSGTGTVTLYTTDGSDPRTSETAIELTSENGTFNLTETTTVNAVSYLTDGDNTIWSNVVTTTYEFIENNGKTYDLLTTNPVVGNIYVIVNKAGKVGLSTTQNATNRAAIGVTFVDEATKEVVNGNTDLAEFMLESTNAGRYYFRQVGTENYLTVTTNANANLMTGAAGTDAEAAVTVNSSVTSGVDESYPATISFSYDGTSRYMRYFANGRAFSTYTSATVNEDVFLYGIAAPTLLPPEIDPKSMTVADGTIINGTVTPDEENPEGTLTWYTTDGSDPRTSSTRILWTEENNGAFNNIIDNASVKAVSGYYFGDRYVYSVVVTETYHFAFATTLAWIERDGVVETEYIVANELIGAWAVVDGNTKLLWAKDQGDISINKCPGKTDGQRDYVKDILKYKRILDDEVQPTWDESNWVVLDFSGIEDDPFEFVGHRISANSVKGVYSNNVNYTITLTDSPVQFNGNPLEMDVDEYQGYDGPFPENKLGDKYDLAYNTYVPANFMTENHNQEVDGKVVGFVADNGALPACQGDSLYFVNPKIQEVAHIWAVWNGGDDDIFTVYETEHKENENINAWHLNGTFRVNWTYNCTGVDPNENTALVYGRPTDLVPNMAYEFHAVVMRPANGTRLTVAPQGTAEPGTPSASYMVYPLDMSNNGTPTAVLELSALKTVASVTYYNLMGVESKKPFDGVNIVVTRYSDGSIMTQKVLR